MATIKQIRDAMHRQPFRPFRIKLVDGTGYEVKHPDFIATPPGARAREVVFYVDGATPEDYESHWIDLGLVVEVIVPGAEPAPSTSVRES
jgi:hypothetical protein